MRKERQLKITDYFGKVKIIKKPQNKNDLNKTKDTNSETG